MMSSAIERASVIVALARGAVFVVIIAAAAVCAWFVFDSPVPHLITLVAGTVLVVVAVGSSIFAAIRVRLVARAVSDVVGLSAQRD